MKECEDMKSNAKPSTEASPKKKQTFHLEHGVKTLVEIISHNNSNNTPRTDMQYGKVRWLLTCVSVLLYVVDIGTDINLGVKYFLEEEYLWCALTLLFVGAGAVVTQIFSYEWYQDDKITDPIFHEGTTFVSGFSKGVLAAMHVFGMGIFTRYFRLLTQGFKAVWRTTDPGTEEERREIHHDLFCQAADLSMLKLFEGFLESVPQLLLQLYIVLGREEGTGMQYATMTFSFMNTAWALVDYRRCLRRSLPHIRDMPCGHPTCVYFLYKLCTITSHLLSFTLLLLLNYFTTVALSILLWLLLTIWVHCLNTNFCTSKGMEGIYRVVIGVILVFTFFNAKGQNTSRAMILYYLFHSCLNILAPLLLFFLRPEALSASTLVIVSILIAVCSVLGLFFLVLYYCFLHPRAEQRQADEVDGLAYEAQATTRMRNFLQP